eukprot:TRINITY_DN9546_c0_g1_i1.p1 TRINITY_DN9546_c0_g1~~TRINITY_DN9546_c0_g1_i1.p1  ORF type:complete len:62 (-),score=0.98 TRINITY_DN9546_c0_g1_i1:324-509(-)
MHEFECSETQAFRIQILVRSFWYKICKPPSPPYLFLSDKCRIYEGDMWGFATDITSDQTSR